MLEWHLSLPLKVPAQCHFLVPLLWVQLMQAQTLLQLQTKLRDISHCAPLEEPPQRDNMAAKPLLVAPGKSCQLAKQMGRECYHSLSALRGWKLPGMLAMSAGWGRGALYLQGVWTCCLRSWAVWGPNVTPEKAVFLKRNSYFGYYTSDQGSHA